MKKLALIIIFTSLVICYFLTTSSLSSCESPTGSMGAKINTQSPGRISLIESQRFDKIPNRRTLDVSIIKVDGVEYLATSDGGLCPLVH